MDYQIVEGCYKSIGIEIWKGFSPLLPFDRVYHKSNQGTYPQEPILRQKKLKLQWFKSTPKAAITRKKSK